MTCVEDEDKIFLGFDFSTQQIKAVAVDWNLQMLATDQVSFDLDLPEYRTHKGVHEADGDKVTAPTIMWVKGLDILMEKLRIAGVDLAKVAAISGGGQQHGSVYWRTGASEMLRQVRPDKFLHDELAHAFSVLDSPVWMDSSTTKECRNLEEAVGGPQKLANLTGSRGYERFTANQIAKIATDKPEAYANTERISLVSSFAASLFVGQIVPIDMSDGSGMNLLDISTKDWCQECLDACAPNLREKLGPPVVSSAKVGNVSEYMVERYGFDPECSVVAFVGDNPSTLAGMRFRPGDLGITMGTSDCVFAWISSNPQPQLTGHIFINPVQKEAYMALLCYKNGSVTRERLRDEVAEGSWDLFNQLLDSTPRGNFGNIAMYYDHTEITPHNKRGDYRYNKAGDRVSRFASKEAEIRALVEGQFMAKRLHVENMGFIVNDDTRILVAGGGSVNKAILQIIADVFNASVYTLETHNVCALGSAFRARHTFLGGEEVLSFAQALQQGDSGPGIVVSRAANPHKDAKTVYKPLLKRFKTLEDAITAAE